MNGKVAAFAAVGMMLAGQAFAAEAPLAQINGVQGQVLVSHNGKFVPASSLKTLSAGDRVVAKDGQAQLKFSDGCVVSLKPQGMATVGAQSPCATGAGLVSASQGDSSQLFGLSGFGAAAVTFGALALILLVVGDSGNDNTAPVTSP